MAIALLSNPGQMLAALLLALAASCGGDGSSSAEEHTHPTWSLIADHNSVDISAVPESWIQDVRENIRLHYAHTSHGSQLMIGLEEIEGSGASHDIEIGYRDLPDRPGELCIFDGQLDETYISPDLFWETQDGLDMTRAVLDQNPLINVCMWAWCSQLDHYGAGEVQAYLDAMTTLEAEYPEVTFVYMTGNAQASGEEGYNRFLRNNQIREHCERGGLALFDFADLDCWHIESFSGDWDSSTFTHENMDIPVEHSAFRGDEAGHTTYESCEQKGKALWRLLAAISGWSAN